MLSVRYSGVPYKMMLPKAYQWMSGIAVQVYPACIYLLKVSNKNTRTRSEICSKLTIKAQERRQWHRSGVFNFNFEHISQLVLKFLLLTLCR